MLVYPQTLEFTRNCHRQIGFFLLVEAPAPIPSEHRSLLGNACCGYAILQIAGLHNAIVACFALLFWTARLYSKGDPHWLSPSKDLSFPCGAFCTPGRSPSFWTAGLNTLSVDSSLSAISQGPAHRKTSWQSGAPEYLIHALA